MLAIGFILGTLFAKRKMKKSLATSDQENASKQPSEHQEAEGANVGELESPQAELKANERWGVNELPADTVNR